VTRTDEECVTKTKIKEKVTGESSNCFFNIQQSYSIEMFFQPPHA